MFLPWLLLTHVLRCGVNEYASAVPTANATRYEIFLDITCALSKKILQLTLAGQCLKRKRALRQTKNKAKNVIPQKASSATSPLGLVAASHMNTLSATILPMSM